jgi:hypothetical protein
MPCINSSSDTSQFAALSGSAEIIIYGYGFALLAFNIAIGRVPTIGPHSGFPVGKILTDHSSQNCAPKKGGLANREANRSGANIFCSAPLASPEFLGSPQPNPSELKGTPLSDRPIGMDLSLSPHLRREFAIR